MNLNIFDTLLEPIFVLREDKSIVYCNEPAATMAELSIRKVTRGLKLDEVFNFNQAPEWLQNLSTLSEASPYKEVAFNSVSGKMGKVQLTAQPLGSGLWLIFFRDVTLEETLQKKYRAELEKKEKVIIDLEKAQAALQEYSKNLEKMVSERTAEIQSLNKMMTALLDSLDQGFFLFNADGLCLPIASKACERTLEKIPPGLFLWDVLGLDVQKKESLKKWILTLFSEMLPFDELTQLGPPSYQHSQARNIHLEYYPLRNETQQIEAVVVVATDTTNIDQARAQAERDRAYSQLIINLIKKKAQIAQFIGEAHKLIHALSAELTQATPQKETLFRYLHSLKGGAAAFSIQEVAETCHQAENILSKSLDTQTLSSKTTEIAEKFQSFLRDNEDILGASATRGIRTVEISLDTLSEIISKLNLSPGGQELATDLQQKFLSLPIANYFEVYADAIQQTASLVGKKVAPLKLYGGDIPIDSDVFVDLFTSFVHQFRNAVDHGIEAPELRLARGKTEYGNITVQFSLIHQEILRIEVQDDGGGIDPKKIREKLKQKGIACDHESDEEVIQHVFNNSFSTKEQVSSTSGRGVGLDAILHNAKKLGGWAKVESKLEKGTKLIVEVPYKTQAQKQPKNQPKAA